MSFLSNLSKGYAALSGPAGKPQTAGDAIDKLADRLANSESPEDRRTALLGVKGLGRDYKADVGLAVMPTLLTILERDAADDTETAKIVLETLNVLCEVDDPRAGQRSSREPSAGLRNTDRFLGTDKPLHALLNLLRQQHFYVRYFSLQLLGTLLSARPEPVQAHVLVAPGGLGRLVEVLEDKREIVRNEGLLLLISLASTNADIQKIVAFEGAFDKLFNIIDLEGGISAGGIVVQDCLAGVIGLLRYNVSNQNYFRETSCIPRLAPLLGFPPTSALAANTSLEAQTAALQGFATQQWPDQKATNADLVLSIARTLVGGAGEGRTANQKALLSTGLSRCFAELALASNAPSPLKAQAMLSLADTMRNSPQNQDMFAALMVSPLIPVLFEDASPDMEPDWQRAEPVPANLALVAMAVQGDPGLGQYAASLEGLKARASAVGLLEAYTASNPDAQVNIVSSMSPKLVSSEEGPPQTAGTILLSGLRALPPPGGASAFDSHAPLFSSLMLATLLRNTESCKRLARELNFPPSGDDPNASIDDEKFGLIHAVIGDLMLAQREQATCAANPSAAASERMTDWSRVMVGYLVLLCVWMWESPRSIRDFLSEGTNIQVLVTPVTQASGVDSLVQGLCAFLLSIVYEYNREPGSVTRAALHPILTSRIGPDQFVSRIARLRDDPRFKNVGPDILERAQDVEGEDPGLEEGFWFDWSFIEFVRNNYLSVQRAVLLDPGQSQGAQLSADSSEMLELLGSLRAQIERQQKELEALQKRAVEIDGDRDVERRKHAEALATAHAATTTERDAHEATRTGHADALSQAQADLETERQAHAATREAVPTVDLEPERQQHADAIAQLNEQIAHLRTELEDAQTKRSESEKEMEDLLVLLDEVGGKRKADKAKLRELGAEVSEDEAEDDADE